MTAHPIVIGTAGHIDHGKTTLVHALTGIDTDRLAVEKERGITTELGFARLDLPTREGVLRLAVVDVPGHERFVKSMVAGATGLDLVLLVIAAEEGVMPQTREHLAICDLLGVRRGVIVLTKADLVDAEWLAMVSAEVSAAVAGTFLADAPIHPVSAKTGVGLDALKASLAAAVRELPPRAADGVFRMPIDRVFTLKGFGTIVTGTVLGGAVSTGDELVVIPSGLSVRVRGLEMHGAPTPRAVAGHRVAINLGGVAVDELARGDLLAHPDRVAASHILDVELAAPLPGVTKVLLHHGTAQVLATLATVGGEGSVLAQLRLPATAPLGALPGDRFLLRGFERTADHGTTIGGGRVVRVLAPRARAGSQHGELVAMLASARRDQRLALDIRTAAAAGLAVPALVRRLGLTAAALAEPLATLVAAGELLGTGDGDATHYLHAETVATLEQKILGLLGSAPDGVPREQLRTQLPAALPPRAFDKLVAGLVRRSGLVEDGERLRRSAAPLRPTLAPLEAQLLEHLRAWALEPPRPKDLPTTLGLAAAPIEAALARLVTLKLAVRVKPDYVVHAEVLSELQARLLAALAAHPTIDAQQWKELTGASRKFTIPLAEYFDAQKVTLRIGDVRRKR